MGTRSYVDGRIAGDEVLTVGQSSGTVVLALGEIPSRVFLTVETPDGSVMFAATDGDLRDDGFDFDLSAEPMTTGCKLHYICDF